MISINSNGDRKQDTVSRETVLAVNQAGLTQVKKVRSKHFSAEIEANTQTIINYSQYSDKIL
ncbi:MAG: hypothetical protein V7K47_24975 [Nostoc sp.]